MKTHKTRFTELGYWQIEPGCWQCVDLTGDRPAQVGYQYATKAELLANLEAYATEYGCDRANPRKETVQEAWTRGVLEGIRLEQRDPKAEQPIPPYRPSVSDWDKLTVRQPGGTNAE
jgi:hypothetical protein